MRHYFIKSALRSFKKFKRNFLINLIGLASAFAGILLITLWVADEYTVDRFHAQNENIYQIMQNYADGEEVYTFEWTAAPLANAIAEEIPQVMHATNVYTLGNEGILKGNDASSIRTNEIYAGEDFFTMFSFELLQGDHDEVLALDNAIVISEEVALTMFGTTQNIIGKTLDFDQQELSGLYSVSGVFKNVPDNSTLQFDAVFSFEQLRKRMPELNNWESNEPFTFVQLQPDTNLEAFNTAITNIVKKKYTSEKTPTLFTRPFADRYLYNTYENGIQSGGRISYVRLFSIIALFILIIAVINFINLSTAQAVNRVKEIGIRKVLGIEKRGLIIQFLGEAVILSFLSLFVAVTFVVLILPTFNEIVGKDISWQITPGIALFIIMIVLVTGILSGIYPSLHLARFKVGSLLNGKYTTKGSEKRIRQGLVIFQFAASVFLIVAVLVITSQIDLVQNKELGYNKEQVLHFKKEGKIKTNLNSFLQELRTVPGVVEATSMDLSHLTNNETSTRNVVWEGKDPTNKTPFKYILGNYNLIELLGLEVIKGRAFSKEFTNERQKIVLNEAAVRQIGLENPVGQSLKIWNSDVTIIGVVNDFHFQSLYEEVQPLFMRVSDKGDEIMVKISGDSASESIAKISAFYKDFNYGLPMEFSFLDKDYQQLYEAETRVASLSKYFGGLAIIISCLGLFGLITFSIGKRYKEIGVRKVLGASVANIVVLVSKDFIKVILLSILVATPLAWYAMDNWLQNFAYRIDLGPDIFISAGVIAIIIATATISFQVIRVAIANPVKSLRTE